MPARPSSRTSRRAAAGGLALTLALMAGCYRNPDPTSWDDAKAKSNFVLGCTRTVTAGNGTTTSIAIADKATCECIYDLIKKPTEGKQGDLAIEWDDLKEYEAKQATAKPGNVPEAPKRLREAVDRCQGAGPAN